MGKKESLLYRLYSEDGKITYFNKKEAWSVKIGRFFGMPLARLLASLPFKVNPCIITILTIPFAILAGFCFFKNLLIYGAIFYLISWILDCTDGSLARMTNTKSDFGSRLDNYSDRANNFIMYFGLWYSQFYLNNQWLVGSLLFGSHYLIMLFGKIFVKYSYKTIIKSIISYYHPHDESFLALFMLPIFNVFVLFYPLLIICQYFFTLVLFLIQNIASKNKTLKS